MGLIREPKGVDFVVESKPWTDDELIEFRALMKKLKETNQNKSQRVLPKRTRKKYA